MVKLCKPKGKIEQEYWPS